MNFTPVNSPDRIEATARLAEHIWNEHYRSLLGQAQVDYMLARFQSAQAIAEQIAAGLTYFLIRPDDAPVGYFAFKVEEKEQRLFLSKLYIDRAARGQGIAAQVLAFLEERCSQGGLTQIWLMVNKGNSAVKAYERLGFVIREAIVTDIGGGYVMDDFRMEKAVLSGKLNLG